MTREGEGPEGNNDCYEHCMLVTNNSMFVHIINNFIIQDFNDLCICINLLENIHTPYIAV